MIPNIFGGNDGGSPTLKTEAKMADPNFLKAIQTTVDENVFDKEKLDRMYRFPANYKEALMHRKASRFGYACSKLKNNEEVPICPCCESLASTVNLPLCYSTRPKQPEAGQEVFLIDTDVSMYFSFVKMIIIYLILRFLVVDLYTILTSKQGHYCDLYKGTHQECAHKISGYNLKDAQDQTTLNTINILSFAFTILSIIFFLLFKKQMLKLRDWLDFSEVSQDDFTVLVENVPRFIYDEDTKVKDVQFYYEYEIKTRLEELLYDWLEEIKDYQDQSQARDQCQRDFWKFIFKKKQGQSRDPDDNHLFIEELVTSITLCYDLTEIQNLNDFREQLVADYLAKNQEKDVKTSNLISHIPNQIDLINKEYIQLCTNFAQDESPVFNLSHFVGKAFVSFQYQHFRDYCVNKYHQDPSFFTICDQQIKISKTNQPTDIFWYNMKVTDAQRAKNIFYSYAVLLMLLTLSFAALLGLQFWNMAEEEKQVGPELSSKLMSYVITGSMAILTNVINYILSYSIEVLSDMQKHKTKSDRLSSLLIKILVSQTINTSIIYTILYFMRPQRNPLGTYGLVSKVVSLVVVSGFISVALQVFVPVDLITRLYNQWKYSEEKPINLFQVQLNKALQYPEFNYSARYSFYIVYSFVISFYGFLVPTASPILIGIFFIQFWVDKYNLFRRYSSPSKFGEDLVRMILKSFQVSLLFYVGGFFLWDSIVHYDSPAIYRGLNIANLFIATAYIGFSILVPYHIKKKCFGEDNQSFEHINYTHYRNNNVFKKTFWRENPATCCLKQTAILQHVDDVEYRNEAPDPKFIKEAQFDKYINITEEDLYKKTYTQQVAKYFLNLGNQEYDYAEDLTDIEEANVDRNKQKGKYRAHK